MKAWILNQAGGPENFELQEIDRPMAQAGEALVKVKAIGLNRHDVMSRNSLKPDASLEDRVMGIEIAGEVVDIHTDGIQSCCYWRPRSGDYYPRRICRIRPHPPKSCHGFP